MNKITKPIIVSALSALAFGTVGVAGTFALFTDGAETQITASAGIVKASIAFDGVATYSAKADADGSVIDERGGKYKIVETAVNGTFTNGGTASIDDQTHYLTLDQITPGDKVAFTINPSSTGSTVDIQYRLTYAVVQDQTHNMDLAKGLVTTIGSTSYVGLENYQSGWTFAELGGDPLSGVAFTIELPITAGNQYQGKSATIALGIEAVQGNAAVFDSEYAKCYDDGEAEAVVPATGPTVVSATNEAQTATVKATIPANAAQIAAGDTVKLLVSDVETKDNASDPTYQDLEFDASLYVNNVKVTQFSEEIDVEVQLATGLVISGVKHNDEPVANYAYNSETGKLTFSTSSFSPFVVTYKVYVPTTTYGFYDSIPVPASGSPSDPNYVPAHYEHYISTFQHFSNIGSHTSSEVDGDGIKIADENTVYILKNDIDFTDQTSSGIGTFIGTLDGNGHYLKNASISSPESNVGLIAKLAGQQVKVKNLKVKNTTVSGNVGVGTLFGGFYSDASITDGASLSFENVTIEDTVSVVANKSAGGIIGKGQGAENLSFVECANEASILAIDNHAGGFSGSCSYVKYLTLDDCSNSGAICSGTGYCGGLISAAHSATGITVTDCTNSGTITAIGGGQHGWLIARYGGTLTAEGNANSGYLRESNGGIVAETSNGAIENNTQPTPQAIEGPQTINLTVDANGQFNNLAEIPGAAKYYGSVHVEGTSVTIENGVATIQNSIGINSLSGYDTFAALTAGYGRLSRMGYMITKPNSWTFTGDGEGVGAHIQKGNQYFFRTENLPAGVTPGVISKVNDEFVFVHDTASQALSASMTMMRPVSTYVTYKVYAMDSNGGIAAIYQYTSLENQEGGLFETNMAGMHFDRGTTYEADHYDYSAS